MPRESCAKSHRVPAASDDTSSPGGLSAIPCFENKLSEDDHVLYRQNAGSTAEESQETAGTGDRSIKMMNELCVTGRSGFGAAASAFLPAGELVRFL
jgi:hypothetical protein